MGRTKNGDVSKQEGREGGSSSDASTSSSEEKGKNMGQNEDEDDAEEEWDKVEDEPWVSWMIRTARVASSLMGKAKIPDWAEEQKRRQWRWAGHVVRREDRRCSHRMLMWEPRVLGLRSVGRPGKRWEDTLRKFASAKKFNWRKIAKDREEWSRLEDEFVAFKG